MAGSPLTFWLVNRSGYDSGDLRRFFARAFRATRTKALGLTVHVTATPKRTKGCADIGGKRLVIAIAPPAHFSLRRLARVTVHEIAHLRGMRHEEMMGELLYSPDRGETPKWARGAKLRWRMRAPRQLSAIRADGLTLR